MKSGVSISYAFLFLDNTYISDNLDYAIYTSKEEHRHCFKIGKAKVNKSLIHGNVGGPWGEISFNKKTLCSGCTTTSTKIKKKDNKTSTGNTAIKETKEGNQNKDNINQDNINNDDKKLTNNNENITNNNKMCIIN
jgi:hypothetical protein